MSIRIGLYDFFAFTIPGIFYLFTAGYLYTTYGIQGINIQALKEFSSLLVVFGAGVAYILGNLLDKTARQWQRFFIPKDTAKKVFEAFKANHPQYIYKFQHTDADVLRSYIKRTDPDTASAIEKNGATRTMFRNISLNFLFLSVIFLIQAITSNNWVTSLLVALGSFTFSIVSGKQGARYDEWYHALTYESIIASSLKPTSFVGNKKRTSSK